MFNPIFISGPHGGGKTTLINNLQQSCSDLFIENDFDIDLFLRFPNFKNLNSFEKCLIKLYHRYIQYEYIIHQPTQTAGKTTLVSRSIYDAIAYIETYKELNIISNDDYSFLASVYKNIKVCPYVIILNPDVDVIAHRLKKRRLTREREERDTVFAYEDTLEFLEIMHRNFYEMKKYNNVKYITDNDKKSMKEIIDWVTSMNKTLRV